MYTYTYQSRLNPKAEPEPESEREEPVLLDKWGNEPHDPWYHRGVGDDIFLLLIPMAVVGLLFLFLIH